MRTKYYDEMRMMGQKLVSLFSLKIQANLTITQEISNNAVRENNFVYLVRVLLFTISLHNNNNILRRHE